VELRFFGGLTAEETSAVLTARGIDTSLRTVERDWKFAQAWLHNAIQSP
jgi:DNA invertase Pin-like site-specific DNA recombinase